MIIRGKNHSDLKDKEEREREREKSLSHVWLFASPMDCSLPGSSAHEIFQARILEWISISFSRGSSRPRHQTQVSHIAGRRFTVWATRERKQVMERKLVQSQSINSINKELNSNPDTRVMVSYFTIFIKEQVNIHNVLYTICN